MTFAFVINTKKINKKNLKNIKVSKSFLNTIKPGNEKEKLIEFFLLQNLFKQHQNIDIIKLDYIKNENKKPEIPNLNFNISNSKGYLIVAVSDSQVGVDIEVISKRMLRTTLYKTFDFANRSKTLKNFYFRWTRLEAFFKMTGEGISTRKLSEKPSSHLFTKITSKVAYSISTPKKQKVKVKVVSGKLLRKLIKKTKNGN